MILLLLYTLAGFFLAPWLVQRQLVSALSETLKRPVSLERVAINPFVLSAEARGFRIDEQDESVLAGFDRLYINFQLSSLFNLAWTFRDLEVDHPYGELIVLGGGESNFSRLVPENSATTAEPATGLVPLIIHRLAVSDGEFQFTDASGGAPKSTAITPISLTIHDLSTLEGEDGEHRFEAHAGNNISLAWQGNIQLNPLNLEGKLQAAGAYLPLIYKFVEDKVNVAVDSGDLQLELGYRVMKGNNGISAAIEQLQLEIGNLQASDKNTGESVVHIPALRLKNLNFSWPQKTLDADKLAIDSAQLLVRREAGGAFNLQQLVAQSKGSSNSVSSPSPPSAAASTEKKVEPLAAHRQPETAAANDWRLELDTMDIRDLNLKFEDHSLKQPGAVDISDLDLTLANISNSPKSSMPLSLAAVIASGGTLSAKGDITLLPEVDAQLQLAIADLNLVAAQAYISQYAAMTLESGSLDGETRILSNPEQTFAAEGELAVSDLRIVDTARKRPLLGWQKLAVSQWAFASAGNRLEINTVSADAPYGRLRIAQDQTTNFQKLLVTPAAEEGTAGENLANENRTSAENNGGDQASDKTPFTLSIGRIDIHNGAGDFADRSLPIPFDTSIATINGKVTTIDTGSSQPATVELEGQVNEYGLAKIGGTLLPLGVKEQADIRLLFRNLELPDLTPYAIKFAGREIANGRMNLDLRYLMTQGKLKAQNNIVISDLELGEKVDYEGALDLPLGLAIALLKDANGKIDIDLPVEGDTNNPEFRLGSIIGQVFVNLITKAVTAPFRLLGALVGMESTDFDRIEFEPGLATLTPPEKEKMIKLAEAMAKRPQLGLRIAGAVDEDADPQALKKQRVQNRIDALVQQHLAENPKTQLEALHLNIVEAQVKTAFPETPLDDIRAQFLKPVNPEKPEVDTKLDTPAYEAALRKRLVAVEAINDEDLNLLAMARAENLKNELLQVDSSLDERIITERGKTATLTKTGWVQLKLRVDSL